MSMDGQEIVLATSNSETSISVWDILTGTFLTSFKGNKSSRNCFCRVGNDHIAAAQLGKNQPLNFWAWHKDQAHQRSFMPQTMNSLACSQDGWFCVTGSDKGSVFLWEAGSGRLLRTWTAHYKAVNAMAFTDEGSVLVTAGEDAIVSAWLLMDLLNVQTQQNTWDAGPQPLHSWSQHTLPVTAVTVGSGMGNTVVASASLDHTCKIWSLATGQLLKSLTLPASLHSIVFDPWEHNVYLGAGDGRIFEVPLTHQADRIEEGAEQLATSSNKSPSDPSCNALLSHMRLINCLATSSSGFQLVSGSDDGSIKIWDLQSRQCLRTMQTKGPVTSVLVCKKPPHLAVGKGMGSGKTEPKRVESLPIFSKLLTSHSERPWEGPPIILDGMQKYRGAVTESGLLSGRTDSSEDLRGLRAGEEQIEQHNNQEREDLEQKLETAMKTIADLRNANSKLHAFVIESSLGAKS